MKRGILWALTTIIFRLFRRTWTISHSMSELKSELDSKMPDTNCTCDHFAMVGSTALEPNGDLYISVLVSLASLFIPSRTNKLFRIWFLLKDDDNFFHFTIANFQKRNCHFVFNDNNLKLEPIKGIQVCIFFKIVFIYRKNFAKLSK